MWLTLLFLAFGEPIIWEKSNEDFSSFIGDFRQVVVTEQDEIFMLDRDEQRIFHLDAQGTEKNVFGRKGEGPGEMNGGYLLQYNPRLQALFIQDWSKPQLHAFSVDGRALSLDISDRSSPIVLNKNQVVYIQGPALQSEPNRGGKIILETLDSKDKVELYNNDASRHQDSKKVGGPEGSATVFFEWYAMSLLAASPNLRLLIIGSNMSLDFRIYDLAEKKMVGHIQAKDVVRHPLKQEEIKAHRLKMNLGGKVYRATDFPHPDYKPPVKRVFFDAENRIWVLLTHAWQAKKRSYRVFSRTGTDLGRFQLEKSRVIKHADKSHLWITRYDDEEDNWYLQKRTYQLTK